MDYWLLGIKYKKDEKLIKEENNLPKKIISYNKGNVYETTYKNYIIKNGVNFPRNIIIKTNQTEIKFKINNWSFK
jgi:outer membrane biogenesis lipoprotein LolB